MKSGVVELSNSFFVIFGNMGMFFFPFRRMPNGCFRVVREVCFFIFAGLDMRFDLFKLTPFFRGMGSTIERRVINGVIIAAKMFLYG